MGQEEDDAKRLAKERAKLLAKKPRRREHHGLNRDKGGKPDDKSR